MVLLIGVIVRALAFITFSVAPITPVLSFCLAHEQVGHDTTRDHAHGNDVEKTDECQGDADASVDWVLGVKNQEGDEAHEETLAVEELDKLSYGNGEAGTEPTDDC